MSIKYRHAPFSGRTCTKTSTSPVITPHLFEYTDSIRSALPFQWLESCWKCRLETTYAGVPGTTTNFSYLNTKLDTAVTSPSCKKGQPMKVRLPTIFLAISSTLRFLWGFRTWTTIDLLWLSEPCTLTLWNPTCAACDNLKIQWGESSEGFCTETYTFA